MSRKRSRVWAWLNTQVENPFFDQDRASAILGFVQRGFALALELQQRPDHRRPAEHGDEAVVEDVMEVVVVLFMSVVRQPIAPLET